LSGLGESSLSLAEELSLSGYDTWDRTIHVSYDPKEDISTYELALILGYFTEYMDENWIRHMIYIRRTKWDVIPDNVKRHFKVDML
jgi:hypothetical protein